MTRALFLLLLLFSYSLSAQVNLNQGLVAYYPFNGNANDASGNNINGIVTNATLTTDRTGVPNNAYYFDGASSYIQLPYNNLYNFAPQDTFSISVWVLPDQGYTWPAQALVVKSPPNPDFYQSNWNYGSYILSYKAMTGFAANNFLNGTTVFTSTTCWYNIIVIYKNGAWDLYVDGVLEAEDLSRTKYILQDGPASSIALGKKGESFGDWYKGKMDEVRIYNRALNPDEINFIAFNGSPVTALPTNSAICINDSIQLSAAGVTNFSWSPSIGLNDPNISNPVASPTNTTQYVVSGTNSYGCSSNDTVLITVNPKPIITKSNDTLICKNATVQLFTTGGTTYSWSPAASLNDPNISNPVATPSTNTEYYVTVTGVNSCSNTDSIQVNIRPDPVFTISPSTELCENSSAQLTASGGDIFVWQPSTSLNNPNISNPISTTTATTAYSVQITDTVCNNTTTLSTTVTVMPLPIIQTSKSNDIDCSNDASQLNATGAVLYTWSPIETLDNPNIQNPIARPATTTQYSVKGTDASGCTNTDTITVNVTGMNKGGYLMPNAFTPNHDGKNDCYGVKYWGVILELDFSIYNRWGQRIFHTNQPGQCWDGTFNGQPQNPDVYIYMIKAKTLCDQEVFRKGTFTLIR